MGGGSVAAGSGASQTTTKSAASQVNGGAFRRSLDRRSTATDPGDALRSSLRRSQVTTAGKSAVLRARVSNRRDAPRRTIKRTGFCFATQRCIGPRRFVRKPPFITTAGRRPGRREKDAVLGNRPVHSGDLVTLSAGTDSARAHGRCHLCGREEAPQETWKTAYSAVSHSVPHASSSS